VRRRRLAQLALVTAAVVAGIVTIAITTGGAGQAPRSPPHPTDLAHQIDSLLAGIPQSSNTLGRATAPVTLRWFGDMECPFCKEFALGALPSIVGRWVRGGQLKIEYFSMETATREPKVFQRQEVAALAAGLQDRMWNYLETFYHEQGEEDSGYVTERYLQGIAAQVSGLNQALWAEDRHDPALPTRLKAAQGVVLRAGFTGTPAFLIGRSGGVAVRFSPKSLTSPRPFDAAIEYLLDRGRPAGTSQYIEYQVPPNPAALFPLGPPLTQEALEFPGDHVA
jgi:protein-disulfide isomerase